MRVVMLLAASVLVAGCVPFDVPGQPGVPLNAANQPHDAAAPQPLQVSAAEAVNYSSAYLGLVEVTFENPTAVWKQVVRVAVDFGSRANNQSVTIATSDEIDAWQRAIRLRLRHVESAVPSTAIDLRGLGVEVDPLGTGVDPHPQGAPAAATDGGAPPPAYPDQHLLATPFLVPPGLFTKRWILLSTPENPLGGCVESMLLVYETSDHQTGRVRLPFKAPSAWQAHACSRLTPAGHDGNP